MIPAFVGLLWLVVMWVLLVLVGGVEDSGDGRADSSVVVLVLVLVVVRGEGGE